MRTEYDKNFALHQIIRICGSYEENLLFKMFVETTLKWYFLFMLYLSIGHSIFLFFKKSFCTTHRAVLNDRPVHLTRNVLCSLHFMTYHACHFRDPSQMMSAKIWPKMISPPPPFSSSVIFPVPPPPQVDVNQNLHLD